MMVFGFLMMLAILGLPILGLLLLAAFVAFLVKTRPG